MGELELKTHRERPIPPRAVQELYEHVGWYRPGGDEAMTEVLESGPAASLYSTHVRYSARALDSGGAARAAPLFAKLSPILTARRGKPARSGLRFAGHVTGQAQTQR